MITHASDGAFGRHLSSARFSSRHLRACKALRLSLLALAILLVQNAWAEKPEPGGEPGTFALTGSMTEALGQTATLLTNGQVLVTKGKDAELYDPKSGTFTQTGSMSTDHGCSFGPGPTASLLRTGKVLVAGLGGPISPASNSAELYDPRKGTFSSTGDMAIPRCGHSAVRLQDGRVLLIEGWLYGGYPWASAEIYDPRAGTFASVSGSIPLSSYPYIYGSTATLLHDGRVLVAGGNNSFDCCGGSLASTAIFDPTTNTFSPGPPMGTPRVGHTATLLRSGRVLIAGGINEQFKYGPFFLSNAELYDPLDNSFTAVGSMSTSRNHFTASLLQDGLVLMAGGYESYSSLASAELYDPKSDTFSTTGSMVYARASHIATPFRDGKKVLITGGSDEAPESAEIYFQPR